jgi:hypothetical protein
MASMMSSTNTKWCWARRTARERPTYPVPAMVMVMLMVSPFSIS